MIVSCVLRKSLAFGPQHVEWLGRQVAQHLPWAQFLPFCDVDPGMPHERLAQCWPSWWAKMEAYARLPKGPVLMLDLDTVLLKPWLPGDWEGECAMPNNIADPRLPMGSWQLSTYRFRQRVAEHFESNPEFYVNESEGCDQRYYAKYFGNRIDNASMLWPDAMASFKFQVAQHGLREQAAFVYFHGLPRPWDVKADWIPPLHEHKAAA